MIRRLGQEKINLTFVKAARKTLFRAAAIGERDGAQSGIQQGQGGFRAKEQSAWKVTERGDLQARGRNARLAGS